MRTRRPCTDGAVRFAGATRTPPRADGPSLPAPRVLCSPTARGPRDPHVVGGSARGPRRPDPAVRGPAAAVGAAAVGAPAAQVREALAAALAAERGREVPINGCPLLDSRTPALPRPGANRRAAGLWRGIRITPRWVKIGRVRNSGKVPAARQSTRVARPRTESTPLRAWPALQPPPCNLR